MILTEAEAAKKRCPMSFGPMPAATVTVSQPVNPFVHAWSGGGTASCSPAFCIGSACMAWRWHDDEEEIDIFRSGETDADFAKRRDLVLSRRKGYCGKAGKP